MIINITMTGIHLVIAAKIIIPTTVIAAHLLWYLRTCHHRFDILTIVVVTINIVVYLYY